MNFRIIISRNARGNGLSIETRLIKVYMVKVEKHEHDSSSIIFIMMK